MKKLLLFVFILKCIIRYNIVDAAAHGAGAGAGAGNAAQNIEKADNDKSYQEYLKYKKNISDKLKETIEQHLKIPGLTDVPSSYLQPISYEQWQKNNKRLFDAVEANDFKTVNELLKTEDVDVNSRNAKRETPLIIATAQENIQPQIIKILLDHNADVNATDKWGMTALIHASYYGNPQIVDMLLDHKADVNIADNDKLTPLIFAIVSNKIDIIKKLLEYGANINAKDKDGMTALMHASKYGETEIVKILLSPLRNINVNDKDKYGHSALMYALRIGAKNIVELLKAAGAE